MNAEPATAVLDLDDPRWPAAVEGLDLDPSCSTRLLAVERETTGVRPVLIEVVSDAWSAVYPLLLMPLPDAGCLARTPDLGGPWLRATAVDPQSALTDLRAIVDGLLRRHGAVSEVALLSPWVPHFEEAARAWSARPEKRVVTAVLGENEAAWARLSQGRRSDIRRARRELGLRWCEFGAGDVEEFARLYGQAMDRLTASGRWRRTAAYFERLAASGRGATWLSEARGPSGWAGGLFHVSGRRAMYLYAARSGHAPGGPSAVVWEARERLATLGVEELMLGGGTTTGEDDPLLTFKRSLGDRVDWLWISGRAFNRAAHDAAVAAGLARPLP